MRKVLYLLTLTALVCSLFAAAPVRAEEAPALGAAERETVEPVPLENLFSAPNQSFDDPVPPSICGYQYDSEYGCYCSGATSYYFGTVYLQRFCCHGQCDPWTVTGSACGGIKCGWV